MENLILIRPEELRQLIRDELTNLPHKKDVANKLIEQPISSKQLCSFLSITEPTLIKWRQKGKIPYMQIGSAIRYDKEAVLLAISAKKNGGAKC